MGRFAASAALVAALATSAVAAAGAGGGGDGAWSSLPEGLDVVRARRRPALVWYTGRATEAELAAARDLLEDRSLRRTAAPYVRIRIDADALEAPYLSAREKEALEEEAKKEEPDRAGGDAPGRRPRGEPAPDGPQPPGPAGGAEPELPGADAPGGAEAPGGPRPTPAVREALRLVEGSQSLVVLDFRERVVRRYELASPPEPAALRKELTVIARENAMHVRMAARVEPVVDASEAAFARKKVREAVEKVLPLEDRDLLAKLDPVLRSRVEKLVADYRRRAEDALREAEKLIDEAKKEPAKQAKLFTKAVAALDAVVKEYPFPDVLAKAQKDKTQVLRYLVPAGGPPR